MFSVVPGVLAFAALRPLTAVVTCPSVGDDPNPPRFATKLAVCMIDHTVEIPTLAERLA